MPISRLAIALFVMLCTPIAWSSTQTTGSANKAAIERGRVLYEQHCTACHGKEGRGDGPSAATLKSKPTNLALMQQRNGAFFAAQVEFAVKGASPAVAHGAPGMMVWGAIFRADARGNQFAADARLRDLIAFIESIQEK